MLRTQLDNSSLRDLLDTMEKSPASAFNEILNELQELDHDRQTVQQKLDDPNPFLALFGWGEPELAQVAENRAIAPWNIKRDSELEAVLRSQALLEARRRCLEFYNKCKTVLHMPSFG